MAGEDGSRQLEQGAEKSHLHHKHEAERGLEVEWSCKYSKPTSNDAPPPARGQHTLQTVPPTEGQVFKCLSL